jgi:hypothetical protein
MVEQGNYNKNTDNIPISVESSFYKLETPGINLQVINRDYRPTDIHNFIGPDLMCEPNILLSNNCIVRKGPQRLSFGYPYNTSINDINLGGIAITNIGNVYMFNQRFDVNLRNFISRNDIYCLVSTPIDRSKISLPTSLTHHISLPEKRLDICVKYVESSKTIYLTFWTITLEEFYAPK